MSKMNKKVMVLTLIIIGVYWFFISRYVIACMS